MFRWAGVIGAGVRGPSEVRAGDKLRRLNTGVTASIPWGLPSAVWCIGEDPRREAAPEA